MIEKKRTITEAEASKHLLISMIPITVIYTIPYFFVWKEMVLAGNLPDITIAKTYFNILVVLLGLVVHELIHGLLFSLFCKRGWKVVRFGILWSSLSPYCHCNEPLSRNRYIIATIMPLLVLGVVPGFIGIISGNLSFLFFGVMHSNAAVGDITAVFRLFKEKSDSSIYDHPKQMGYTVVDE